ncbi:MAG: hypothetical protein HZA46_02055 [Planctomycetales bacterium]|nr:hypothetical protein [Planctomycetales bacterium]
MSAIPILITLLCLGQSPADAAKPDAAASEASLEVMQQRVLDARVKLSADAKSNLELVVAPVFRYSDELRQIEDAGIWLWTDRGRPAAAMKVERYKPSRIPTQWLYCFTSLSPELVHAEWSNAAPFQARQPGVKWQALDDEPAKSRPLRLVQLREMARRFSAEMRINADGTNRIQMRLLTRPLFRCDESSDVIDGAVFGMTGTGTNPDVLLLFDLAPQGGWRFGAAGMTTESVTLKLNDRIVYEIPNTVGKGRVFDTWSYFRPTK